MHTCRSHQKELIDLGSAYYTETEYEHCLKMLFRVNQLLGIFYSTKRILKKFPNTSSLLDIGCGGGLFLLHLSKHFPKMQFTGIDISSDAIQIANQELEKRRKRKSLDNVSFQLQSSHDLNFPDNSVSIILATLVCHHITDNDLTIFFQKILNTAREVVIIHDLHRHPLSYWFYKILSPILFRNRLISHDGLISIQRGFRRSELETILQKAGIKHYKISWRFPFHWRLILWKK